MIKTKFMFFKNTPFNDMQNTILFESKQARDIHFHNKDFYETVEDYFQAPYEYNFMRDRSSIDVAHSYSEMRFVNYLSFKTDEANYTTDWTYAHVLQIEYINDNTTRVHFLIDALMTFCQGYVLNGLNGNVNVLRQHLSTSEYNKMLPILKTNDDILGVTTKKYVRTEKALFKELKVLFQCSADLTSDFGDEKTPKMAGSSGNTFDGISSPLDLYLCDVANFKELMSDLSDFPWITQNIARIVLVPTELVDEQYTTKVNVSESDADVYTFKNNAVTSNFEDDFFTNVDKTEEELLEIFNIPLNEEFLFRNNYCNIEVYGWNNQSINIDVSQLDNISGNLKFRFKLIGGYNNQISIFIDRYKSGTGDADLNSMAGSFLNDSITFSDFDEIPIMVDNYKLSLAQNANRRELAESKLISNRVSNIFDPTANTKDRIFDALNVVSGLTNFSNVLGKFTDEYEFYRTQKAEFADMSLNKNSVTNQATGNSFNIKNEMYGITVKYAKMSDVELDKVRFYYKKFGFETENYYQRPVNVYSMSMMNYLQFKGTWKLNDVDPNLMEILKARFEIGVFLWHDNGTANPFTQDLLYNERV